MKFNGKTLFHTTLLLWTLPALAATDVRLAVHDSYDLPKEAITAFESANDAKVVVMKMGDGNEMLNRLILTRNQGGLADAVFGLDNNNVAKAQAAGVLAAQQPASARTVVRLPHALAVDYGFITINYDKKWFESKNLPLPKSLADLTLPAYKDLLAMPNPNTSTPGLAFLLANIRQLGEDGAFTWWAKMRQNGVKITQGWSDAYYKEFTLNGGSRPMMVGYASSPAAEVFYSEGKLSQPNMGNLFLQGGTYLQIEGAAVLNHAKQPALAAKLVQHLQSAAVQQSVFRSMWVYPAVQGTPPDEMMRYATVPQRPALLPAQQVAQKQKDWLGRWTRVVLR